jgi:hypothetical protein
MTRDLGRAVNLTLPRALAIHVARAREDPEEARVASLARALPPQDCASGIRHEK